MCSQSQRFCSLHSNVLLVQAELKRPRFDDGLQGILLLINSVNLTDMLQAADEDIALANDLSRHDPERTDEADQMGNQPEQSTLHADPASNV